MVRIPASEEQSRRDNSAYQSSAAGLDAVIHVPYSQAGPSRYPMLPSTSFPPAQADVLGTTRHLPKHYREDVQHPLLFKSTSHLPEHRTADGRAAHPSAAGSFSSAASHDSMVMNADPVRRYSSSSDNASLGWSYIAPLSSDHALDRSNLTSARQTQPISQLVPPPEPSRARIACSFCRARKLKCDGATPCRHCERRNVQCAYTSTSPRSKSRAKPGAVRANHASESAPPTPPPTTKRGRSDDEDRTYVKSSLSKRSKEKQDLTPSASPPFDDSMNIDIVELQIHRSSGHDLAMIQNDTGTIPLQPTRSVQGDWCEDVFAILGTSRQVGNKLVRHLLTRFVQSNAIFFGLLHAPTLLGVIARHDGYSKADPALYLSVLAVAACDMHQTHVADERTADMRASTEVARKLASKLSGLALAFLQASMTEEAGLTPAAGQAASILALVQPDGSSAQEDLIRFAQSVVRKLKLHESINTREPFLHECGPGSDLYWSRPVSSDSAESEIKYESVVRLCWTGISHRFRRLIAFPDEDVKYSDLPEFVMQIRPMAFWQPSLLSETLPPPFFHSQDLMRRSAHLSRLTVSLAQLVQQQSADNKNCTNQDVVDEARTILASLDQLEEVFLRHRPQDDQSRHTVLGRTLQMFCRMDVWLRLTIWRKFRLWSSPQITELLRDADAPSSVSKALPFEDFHPTVDFWLGIMDEMTTKAREDLDSHVIDQTVVQTTISGIDSLVSHVLCALDIVEASGHANRVLPIVAAALNIVTRFAGVAESRKGFLLFDQQVMAKLKLASDRSSRVQSGLQQH